MNFPILTIKGVVSILKWQKDSYLVSDSKALLDIDRVHKYLSSTYWAKGRSRAIVEKTMEGSLCFGLYKEGEQIGFARVVSDGAIFSWLLDVVIDDAYRGQGLGQWLLGCLLEHPDVKETRMGLATKDAHSFYEKFGFQIESCMRQPK